MPANKNLRPTDGMASYTCTVWPAALNTSAAMSPAGPAPMMAMGKWGEFEKEVTA
jgi:hypothetical protein